VIEADGLTKRYGDVLAVDHLSFTVTPGKVTGFLGPNGAGKSTTMRMIIGLDSPTAGWARVDGKEYRDLAAPLHSVGALLEARSLHPGRSAANSLWALARTHGLPRRRVSEVLDLVGLSEVAGKRIGTFSLGMGQRLGIAAALLADPSTVMLDEPVNGLDPEGVLWVRTLLKALAAEGRTVFVSSHLMSEMALTAEHLIIIGRGRLIADTTVEEVISGASGSRVRVRSPRAVELATALSNAGAAVDPPGEPDVLHVNGWTAAQVGDLAATAGLALHELVEERASLEEAFMELTGDSVQYHGHTGHDGDAAGLPVGAATTEVAR